MTRRISYQSIYSITTAASRFSLAALVHKNPFPRSIRRNVEHKRLKEIERRKMHQSLDIQSTRAHPMSQHWRANGGCLARMFFDLPPSAFFLLVK
jgi:hypothetical protein